MIFEAIQIHHCRVIYQKSSTEIKMQHEINCLLSKYVYKATNSIHYYVPDYKGIPL